MSANERWLAGGKLSLGPEPFFRHLSKVDAPKAVRNRRRGPRRGASRAREYLACALGKASWQRLGLLLHLRSQFLQRTQLHDVVHNLSKFDETKADAIEVDHDYDGVWLMTLLKNGEAMLHNSTAETRNSITAGNATVALPPHSLRSVLINTSPK